ncbi:MAG TPA: glycosyltransferase family 2 protein [Thermoanaerobaculia bacterium]|nr:glycosyltransferase family 2 protein [Thermoanaerobaculia bacterium]
MTPSVSAVVVNHRSASEAADCAASLRAAFEREGVAGEIVLVDCASGEEEAGRLRGIPADALVLLSDNLGYSGGVNAGVARARGAALLLCNADVVFQPGAVSALAAAVAERRVGAAAPLCLWDAAGRLRLPADPPSGLAGELGLVRFAPFARRTLALWERGGEARRLVGAVLAVRREVWDRVGAFDERYPFEYEETDWEMRARRAGFVLRFDPAARVRHLYARSAARNPETEARRAESRRVFRRRHYGALGSALIARMEGGPRDAARATPVAEPLVRARTGAWVAVSTNPSLVPFAGAPLDSDFRLPDEVLASLRPGPVWLRPFRAADGAPLETLVWEKP